MTTVGIWPARSNSRHVCEEKVVIKNLISHAMLCSQIISYQEAPPTVKVSSAESATLLPFPMMSSGYPHKL